jgi:hypothetical protein
LTIGYLTSAETEDLIRNPDPEVKFTLVYTNEAVACIQHDTHCHPFLVQLVCSCAVEQANARRVQRVDLDLTRAAETLALERGSPFFRNIWDEMSGPDGQALLRAISAAPGPLAVKPAAGPERQPLDRMVRYHVLSQTAEGYEVEVPLVQNWVNERAPVV